MAVFEITCMKCGKAERFEDDHPLKAESQWAVQHAPVCPALTQRLGEILNEMNAKIRAEFINLRKVR